MSITLPSIPVAILAISCMLLVVSTGDVRAQGDDPLVKAIYGFSPRHEAFAGKSSGQIAETLADWGVTAVFGGYEDPALVEALHTKGITVFAEVALFVGKKHWERYPQGRPVTSTGKPMAPEGWYYGVNPVIPEIRKEGLGRIKRLLERYPVDGVWLDFCRWSCRWERPEPRLPQTSFDDFTLASFQKDTGITIPPAFKTVPDRAAWILQHHQDDWTDWRCGQITSFVREVREIIDKSPRTVLLGLFSVPWRSDDFNGAIRTIIGQDYKALSEHIDVFSPMVYHKLCGKDVPWIGEVTAWAAREAGKPLWPIIQAMDEPEKITPEELRGAVTTALKAHGSQGVIVFDLKALSSEKLRVVQEVFGKNQ